MEERMRIATVRAGVMVLGLAASLIGFGCGGSRTAGWEEETTTSGSVSSEAQATHDAALAEGEAAWAEREDPERLRAAIAAWTRAVEAVPSDWELWQRLGRAQYFIADGNMEFDPALEAETTAMYQTAITSAERGLASASPQFAEQVRSTVSRSTEEALARSSASVGLVYWRSSALGRWARRDGFATVLAYKDEIRASMTRCLEQRPPLLLRGPDRYFGAFYSPWRRAMPAVTSSARASTSTTRSRVYPGYFGTHVLYADGVRGQDPGPRALHDAS
jgi:hypothetical protein